MSTQPEVLVLMDTLEVQVSMAIQAVLVLGIQDQKVIADTQVVPESMDTQVVLVLDTQVVKVLATQVA